MGSGELGVIGRHAVSLVGADTKSRKRSVITQPQLMVGHGAQDQDFRHRLATQKFVR